MVNSCLSPGTDRPGHQLESCTRQHCFSTLCTLYLTTCLITSALVCCCVPCLPHASPLSSRQASAVLVESPKVANPHHSTPTAKNHRSSPTDAEYHVSIRPLGPSPIHVSLAFPAEIGFDSPCIYTVTHPSAQSIVIHQTPAPPST